VRAGAVTVDGAAVRDASVNVDPDKNVITYNGEVITYSEFVYIVMNKPEGYVCSNDEPGEPLVFDLLDDKYKRKDVFTVGRLDKATSGLIIITKRHVEKTYVYTTADPLSERDRTRLESGIELKDGYTTKPCRIIPADEKSGRIILSEGKYHQIRRMFAAVSNKVETLKRITFGAITLDGSLGYGEWRLMTQEEINDFRSVLKSLPE
jgi:16S rRNA pseudouridine516 synthase